MVHCCKILNKSSLYEMKVGSMFFCHLHSINWMDGDMAILICKIPFTQEGKSNLKGFDLCFYNFTRKRYFSFLKIFEDEYVKYNLCLLVKRMVLIEKQLPYFNIKNRYKQGNV